MNYAQELEIMVNGIFVIYLIWTAWQDYREMQVVRYSHILGIVGVLAMAGIRWKEIRIFPLEYVSAFVIILLLQMIAYWFSIYGMADVVVFCMCGWFFVLHRGVNSYLTVYIMLIAVSCCMLFIVQILKNNIQGLHLKKSVAYIPYICVAFVLTNLVL